MLGRRAVIVRCIPVLCGMLTMGVATSSPSHPIVETIVIEDTERDLGPGAVQREDSVTTTILRKGGQYFQDVPKGEPLDPKLVSSLANLISAWRYPSPSAQSIGFDRATSERLRRDLTDCGYRGGISAALYAYYRVPFLTSDDYPIVHVRVAFSDGTGFEMESRKQQIFGLAWHSDMRTGAGDSYDAAISRAVMALMDRDSPWLQRNHNTDPFNTYDIQTISIAACHPERFH